MLLHVPEGVLISINQYEVVLVDLHSASNVQILGLVVYQVIRVGNL